MPNPLGNLDDAMAALEAKAIRTEHGSYLKTEDVRKWMQEQQVSDALQKADPDRIPERMRPEEARRRIKADPEIMKHFPPRLLPPGASIPAGPTQAHSPSRA